MMPIEKQPLRLLGPARLIGWAAFVLLLAFVLHQVAGSPANYYGTARAPHSDSLTSWVQGTLDFYFSGRSSAILLFRPTVPLLYSSLLTLFGDLAAIPAAFTGILAAAMTAAFALLDARGRAALLALLALLAAYPAFFFEGLFANSLNTELPGFCLGLGGLLLIGSGLVRAVASGSVGAAFYPGFALLGLNAATRGSLLMAIPAILLFGWWVLHGARAAQPGLAPVRTMALGLACTAVPYLIDGAVSHAMGVRSPGLMPLFAVYWDPSHTLTNEAYFAFTNNAPSAGEVLRNYLAFLFSAQGVAVMSDSLVLRLGRDAGYLAKPAFAALAATALLADLVLARLRGEGVALPRLLWKLLVLALAAALLPEAAAPLRPALMAALALLLLAGAVADRLPLTGLFTIGYLSGVGFLVLTGTATYERILFSFLFCPTGAVLWAMVETRRPQPAVAGRWLDRLTGAAMAAVVVALYAANPLVGTPLKKTYAEAVRGRPMAIKVSDDAELDRSLYYGGGTELLYTRRDDRPVGTVRPLRAFVNPTGMDGVGGEISGARLANALFNQPGWFTE